MNKVIRFLAESFEGFGDLRPGLPEMEILAST